MKIQSLSIVVPNKACINNCKFCVSKMHTEDYKNQLDENLPFYDLYLNDYLKCLSFARDNGCNTAMLTGNSEPQQNRQFLMLFGLLNRIIPNPFKNIEMQTTGRNIDDGYLRFLRNHVGVRTISLSINSFDNVKNSEIISQGLNKEPIDLRWLCSEIKKYDFTLRLSINLTNRFEEYAIEEIFTKAKELGANQIIFRVMYLSGENTPQDIWLKNNAFSEDKITEIRNYIKHKGRFLEVLEFGQSRYSVDEMSIVLDDDCMNVIGKETLKYLILRPDCKLYSKWDDKGSLVL